MKQRSKGKTVRVQIDVKLDGETAGILAAGARARGLTPGDYLRGLIARNCRILRPVEGVEA